MLIAFAGTPDGAAQSSGGGGIGYACQTPGPDTYGYVCDGIGSQFQSITASGSVLSLGNDQVSSPLSLTSYGNLTFPEFNFYGKSYDQVFVSSNGFVSFIDPMTSGCCAGGTIPNSTDPNAVVAGYWVDLDPSAGGSIHYQGISSPDRYVIEFNGVPYQGSTNETVTFQIVLWYGSDIVEVHFDEAGSDSTTTTTGIENAAGDTGLTAQHGPGGLPQVENMFESTDGLYAEFSGTTSLVNVTDLRIVDVFGETAGRQVETASADRGSPTLQVTATTGLRFCQVDDGSDASASLMPLVLAVGQTDCSGSVEAGDVLLTAAGGQPGGEFVSTGNPLVGKPFTTTLSGAFMYADVDFSGTYNLGDWVYAKASNTTTSTLAAGDLRLTPTSSYTAFTRVQTGDSDEIDFGRMMVSLGGSLDGTAMRFFDTPPPAAVFTPPSESAPSPPAGLAATPDGDSIILQLVKPDDNGMSELLGYDIYRGTDSTAIAYLTSVSADTSVYTDSGLSGSTSYFYAVSAVNAIGASAATGPVYARTATLDEETVAHHDFDTGATSGWNLTGLWHVDSACSTPPTLPYYLGYHRSDVCHYDTGATNSGIARFTVDLTDERHATLVFDHRWITESYSYPFDVMKVEAKRASDAGWTTLASWDSTMPNQNGWRSVVLDLDAFTGDIAEIRFTFDTKDGIANQYAGWYLDNVEVTAAKGLPSAVQGLVADGGPGVGEITVQWAAPADDGGCTIAAYRLETSTDGENWTVLQNTTTTSYVHTGLGDGATHRYRVTPFNCEGAGPEAYAEGTTFDVPSAPLLLVASAGPGAGEIALDWLAPESDGGTAVSHYNVYRNTTGGSFDLIASPTTTSYVDTGLAKDTTYGYYATAVNLVGEGPASTQAANTTFDVPSAPQDLFATAGPGPGEVALSWSPPVDDGGLPVTLYVVYRDGAYLANVSASTTSYGDTGLADNTTYTYAVTAWNDVGESDTSAPASNTTFDVPAAPQDLTAATGPGAGEIALAWSPPVSDGGTALTGYKVYRSTTTGGPYTHIASPTGTTYQDGGLAAHTTYHYVVSAVNAVGEGPTSAEASNTTFDAPSAPQDLSASAGPGPGETSLSWAAPADDGGMPVTLYTVYRDGAYIANVSATVTSYVDTGLEDGTTYTYTVTATNDVGEGDASSPASTTTFAVPAAPQDLSATTGPGPGEIALSWNAPLDDGGTNVTSYNLYRSTTTGGPYAVIASLTGTAYQDTGLGDDTAYFYVVSAVNAVGEGPAFTEAANTTFAPPGAPQDVTAVAGPDPGKVSLTWSAPADDGGLPVGNYSVYRDGLFVADTASTSYIDAGLADATTYTYTVTAWNDVGEGDASAPVSTTTFGVPSAPQNTSASAGPGTGEIGLSWSAPADDGGTAVTEYIVYRDGMFLDNTTATSYLDAGLADGTTYAYNVSAVNAVGEGPRSATVTATTFAVPAAPENLTATAGPDPNEVSLAWDAPADDGGTSVERYTVYRSGTSGGPWTEIGTPYNTTFLDTGLANGTTYHYQVSAHNLVGEGAVSNEANATAFDVPPEPVHVAATAGPAANEITVSWDPPEDDGGTPITQYVLYRDGAVVSELAVSPYTDSGLANGTTHNYTVRAKNAVGIGPHSAEASATTFDVASEPQNTTAQTGPGGGEITIDWDAPADDGGTPVTNYTIERRADETEPWTTVGMTPDTAFTDSGLGPNATWCYRVAAINLVGQGAYGTTSCATTFALPAAPPVSATSGSGFIDVTWGASPDDGGAPVTETRLYGGDDRFNLTLLATAGPGGGNYTDAGLPDGHWRHYAATAVTIAGESAFDSRVSARTFAPPEAPANTSARSGPGQGEVTVGFATPADDGGREITSFQVYRGLAPDDLSLVATLDPANLSSEPSGSMVAYSYVDSGLANGTTFYYSVSATNDEGEGPRSDPVFGTTYVASDPPEPLPSGRTLTSATYDGRYVYVFGGLAGNTSDGASIDHIVRFDPVNQTNEVFDALPTPRHGTSSVWVPGNESAYIFFGDDQNGTEASASTCHPGCHVGTQILKYVPVPVETEASASTGGSITFIDVDDDVHARHSTASVYVPPEYDQSGRINGTGVAYVFGGKAPSDGAQASTCHPGCHVGSQIGVLDPLLDKFDIHPSQLPQPMWGTSSVYVPPVAGINGTGLIYLFGGHEADDGASASTCHPGCHIGTQILGFDPQTGAFQFSTSSLPSERWYTSATFDGRYAYVFGGEDHNGTIDEIVRFDPRTGEVSVVGTLPSERGGTSAVSTATGIYIFGGEDGNETLDEVVQFRPDAPQSAKAEGGGGRGENTVSWQPPANAFIVDVAGYRVYAGEDPETLSLLAVLPDAQERFVHGGLGDGETWYYRVSAFSAQDEGPQSDTLVANTFTRPSAPQDLAAEKDVVSGIVHLSWDAPVDDGGTPLEHYHVYRRDGPTSGYTVIGNVSPTRTTYADDGCTIGKVCDYHVVAFNLVGGGDLSDQVTVIGTRLG